MKQCPYCKKSIPDSAKVCPYCGNRLEKGYQPMKRTGLKTNYLYILLALVLIFSPVFSTLLFGDMLSQSSSVSTPNKAITLGPLGTADIDKEVSQYYFGNLKDFEKYVSNSDSYVKKIKSMETKLNEIANRYGETSLDKDYDFYVTDQNNVYSNLNYDFALDNCTVSILFEYDLSGKTNDLTITQTKEGYSDFAAMKLDGNSDLMLKEIVTLITDDSNYASYNKAATSFNALEGDFASRSESLGNYGMGVSESVNKEKTSFRILASEKGYRLKLTYRGKIALDKLV